MIRSVFVTCFMVGVVVAAAGGAGAGDLTLSVYATAGSVVKMAESEPAREDALKAMSGVGISKIFIEVHRSGHVVPPEKLVVVRDFFQSNGIVVAGGIATTPGIGFGVAANEGLEWFNFQAPETREALGSVVRQSAPLFDTMIVDDFLCTGDTSEISNQARGDRSWSEYRRDLMLEISKEVLIGPAKEVNPSIRMIIKFPQWYDLFHVYGYDVAREPGLYDRVYVGTETRGANTQRYGFVQPYEGFINYRWIAEQSGEKIGGAWFDHGDCGDFDFLDQAWQSVAAGARELVFFHLGDIVKGHPDHARLRNDFKMLSELSARVRENSVGGVVGYKPPNSDAGDNLYIMDFIGMLGVSIVPSPVFPTDADTIFLPAQAAADGDIVSKIEAALEAGRTLVVTPGFLERVPAMTGPAGIQGPVVLKPRQIAAVRAGELTVPISCGLDTAADLSVNGAGGGAEVLLSVPVGGESVPFLTSAKYKAGRVVVLNTRTFSQSDFDAVGEVLLSPRALGLLNLPDEWVNEIRKVFVQKPSWLLRGPSRVTCQYLGESGWLVQNYNDTSVVGFLDCGEGRLFQNVLPGGTVEVREDGLTLVLPPRGRMWIRKTE